MFGLHKKEESPDRKKIQRLLAGAADYVNKNYMAEKPPAVYPERDEALCGVRYSHADPDEAPCDIRYSRADTGDGVRFSERRDPDSFRSNAVDTSMSGFLRAYGNAETPQIGLNESFSGKVMSYIRKKDLRESQVYNAVGMDRRLFSKIRRDSDYRPSKNTCILFALALRLDLEETNDLLGRAGFTLSHSIKRDVVIEYFIRTKEYSNIYINEVLYSLGLELLNK